MSRQRRTFRQTAAMQVLCEEKLSDVQIKDQRLVCIITIIINIITIIIIIFIFNHVRINTQQFQIWAQKRSKTSLTGISLSHKCVCV